ncbi:MAG: protein kinase domain-containing protein [Saccharofermentanales bacterium]|jgi:serine/threonine protein kinase|nr:hypothetical protein [Bacillota bacterium]
MMQNALGTAGAASPNRTDGRKARRPVLVRDEEAKVLVAKAVSEWTDHRVASILSYLQASEFPHCLGWSGSADAKEKGEFNSGLPELIVSPEPLKPVYLFEYIEGQTLAELRTENLPADRVMDWLLHLAGSLKDLSLLIGNPLLHLDIKPGNIVIMPAGTPALIDFGCALILDDFADKWVEVKRATAAYAAPEVQKGNPHANSDLFSLARTAISVLAGKPYQALTEPDRAEVMGRLSAEHRQLLNRWQEIKPELRAESTAAETKHSLIEPETEQELSLPLEYPDSRPLVISGSSAGRNFLPRYPGLQLPAIPLYGLDPSQPVSVQIEYRLTVYPQSDKSNKDGG